jgi:Tetratricopeptide repeat
MGRSGTPRPAFFPVCKLLQFIAPVMVAIAVVGPAPASTQLREAAALDAKVKALFNAGKYQEALPLAQRSLAIREKTLGPDNLKVG